MARKPLSSIDWMQKNVDDIFAAPLREIESSEKPHVNVHEKIEQFEQKSRLNFNKSRHAPPPPGTKIMLPKIGNYTPKILLSRESTKPVAPQPPSDSEISNKNKSNSIDRKQPHSHEHIKPRQENVKCNMETDDGGIYSTIDIVPDYDDNVKTNKEERKFMIIGDKDTPIVLESSYVSDEDVKDESQVSDKKINIDSNVEIKDELTFEENNVINHGEVVVNPLFEGKAGEAKDNVTDDSIETPRHPYKKRRAPGIPSTYINRHRHNSQNSHDSEEEFPFIPEPDYEEEETTMNFDNVVQRDTNNIHRRDQKIILEYEGEDFSKYFDDEDEGIEDTTFTWRKNIHHQRKVLKQPPPSKTKQTGRSVVNAPKLKPIKKQKKSETQHGSMQRHTLRTISYADCKMGVDDRTVRSVKSTSAGGRYIKRGKERTMIVDGDSGEGGYEEFLRMRHKEDGSLESNSSGDSGHETADEFNPNHFFHMQPKQLKDNHEKGTFWQKLTWRFKRHAYRMT